MTRRELLAAPLLLQPLSGASTNPLDRPMRWFQLAFVEDDPGEYDQAFWLDYLTRLHVDGVCLSAGGCVAFYPTKVPLHYRSKWMKDSDPFGDLVKACRARGMAILARTDPHAVRDDVASAHPDWIAVEADGKPRRHWANPELWVTCAHGPYNFEFMTEVTREIAAAYPIDGVFSNRWHGHGTCYCEHCVRLFKAYSGFDIPRSADPRDPVRQKYTEWHEHRLFELWRLWDAEIKKVRPAAAFIPNSGGGANSELDMKLAGEMAPFLAADRQARRGLTVPWAAGKSGKEYRSGLGMKPIAGIASVGLEEPYRWKDSVQTGPEIQMWIADGIAQGLRPWVTKFNLKLYDKRWLKPVEEIYTWHWRNDRYLRNTANLANVGLVYSQQTARFYPGAERLEDHTSGWYHALVEARIPFEMVNDGALPADPSRFRALVLPNIACMSVEQARTLEAYVNAGGSVIATHETSLYDETGKKRANFALAGLFGATYVTSARGVKNSYINLDIRHPILAGLEDAPRIINGANQVEIRSSLAVKPMTVVPSYPDLPMEDVFPRVLRTDSPAVCVREAGAGRVVYFPWDIDRTFWEVMSPDHGKLLANAVRWGARELAAEVTGPGLIDVAYWRQASSVTVHLVNLTNPMAMKGPIREILPIGAQRVRMRLPQGAKAKSARLLVAGLNVPFRANASGVEVDVPSIGLHEVVAIGL